MPCNRALSREETLRAYCVRLKSERDCAREERDKARLKVGSLVGEIEVVRRENGTHGLKGARDSGSAVDDDDDGKCSA